MALWGLMGIPLSKDYPSTGDDISAQPAAPANESAVTMRGLLHNTKATIERFSDNISTLVQDVNGAKDHVQNLNLQFQQDRDTLRDELAAEATKNHLNLQSRISTQDTKLGDLANSVSTANRTLDRITQSTELERISIDLFRETMSPLVALVHSQREMKEFMDSFREDLQSARQATTTLGDQLQALTAQLASDHSNLQTSVRSLDERLQGQARELSDNLRSAEANIVQSVNGQVDKKMELYSHRLDTACTQIQDVISSNVHQRNPLDSQQAVLPGGNRTSGPARNPRRHAPQTSPDPLDLLPPPPGPRPYAPAPLDGASSRSAPANRSIPQRKRSSDDPNLYQPDGRPSLSVKKMRLEEGPANSSGVLESEVPRNPPPAPLIPSTTSARDLTTSSHGKTGNHDSPGHEHYSSDAWTNTGHESPVAAASIDRASPWRFPRSSDLNNAISSGSPYIPRTSEPSDTSSCTSNKTSRKRPQPGRQPSGRGRILSSMPDASPGGSLGSGRSGDAISTWKSDTRAEMKSEEPLTPSPGSHAPSSLSTLSSSGGLMDLPTGLSAALTAPISAQEPCPVPETLIPPSPVPVPQPIPSLQAPEVPIPVLRALLPIPQTVPQGHAPVSQAPQAALHALIPMPRAGTRRQWWIGDDDSDED